METPQIKPPKYRNSRILVNLGFTHVSPEDPDTGRIREVIIRKQKEGRAESPSPDEGGRTIQEAILLAHDTNPLDVARVVGDTDILGAIQASQKRNEGNVDLGTKGPESQGIRDAIKRALFGHSKYLF